MRYKKIILYFVLLFNHNCISYENLWNQFTDQELLNKYSNNTNFNEVYKQEDQKQNLKKAYNTKKQLKKQNQMDCLEIQKNYIEEKTSLKFLNCN
ncbi:MAG: hypothetical protein ACK4UJ_12280 [Leptonema sp. (in: bacteria)]